MEIKIKPRAMKWSDPNIMKGWFVNMFKSYVKGTYLFYIFLAFLISCSENQTSNEISWEGDSFYVNRENDEFKIDYSVTLDVTSMEIGARINIFSFPEGEIIDKFSVKLIEKEVRVIKHKFRNSKTGRERDEFDFT